MAVKSLLLYFSLFLSGFVEADLTTSPSPYISPVTFSPNYQKMLDNFKIFVYETDKNLTFKTPAGSLFHASLLKSTFITTEADEAHLFYLSFPLDRSHKARSMSRYIRDIRTGFPFWNRTLGADHFYISCNELVSESDRNLVELKTNSIQISCSPATEGRFIPHKDVTLPPLNPNLFELPHVSINRSAIFLGYCNLKVSRNREIESSFMIELRGDPDFLIESEPSDHVAYAERLLSSKFCLFFYSGDVSGIGEALRIGCVPVVISDRPIVDLPFMDVLRWSDIALFVGTGGGVKQLKSVLDRTCGNKYARMRELGRIASQHFVWNSHPQPDDSFYTILYQLWLRRHTIRYARRV